MGLPTCLESSGERRDAPILHAIAPTRDPFPRLCFPPLLFPPLQKGGRGDSLLPFPITTKKAAPPNLTHQPTPRNNLANTRPPPHLTTKELLQTATSITEHRDRIPTPHPSTHRSHKTFIHARL
ncbi:hypothetical protein AZ78_2534 [Lysobacter capsici AZ78]|uniref:Uncharacterized protein n=1 Tax=Lysobacter capsici AZ78 TaxID=1444315 RepID=A0A108U9E5_9GAMM|nr:hypothetical protein AZ78_2534 [Lysobacter capsici AZ78]